MCSDTPKSWQYVEGYFYSLKEKGALSLFKSDYVGKIHPLTEMSTRNFPGGKEQPVHKVDNLMVICEPIV
jgi:hypothetical protein